MTTEQRGPICLVLMPMLDEFRLVRSAVADAISSAGLEMRRLEEELRDSDWLRWLLEALSEADLVLADVTDNNPFVSYELGLAQGRGLPIAVIVDAKNGRIPATVHGAPFLPYGDDLDVFGEALAGWLNEMASDLTRSDIPRLVVDPAASNDAANYELALSLARDLESQTPVRIEPVSLAEFRTRMKVAEIQGDLVAQLPLGRRATRSLLARVICRSDEVRVMEAIEDWLEAKDA